MGYRIKDLRQQQGLSQEALAKKSGISRVTISKLETKQDAIANIDTLRKIADALQVGIGDIFLP